MMVISSDHQRCMNTCLVLCMTEGVEWTRCGILYLSAASRMMNGMLHSFWLDAYFLMYDNLFSLFQLLGPLWSSGRDIFNHSRNRIRRVHRSTITLLNDTRTNWQKNKLVRLWSCASVLFYRDARSINKVRTIVPLHFFTIWVLMKPHTSLFV